MRARAVRLHAKLPSLLSLRFHLTYCRSERPPIKLPTAAYLFLHARQYNYIKGQVLPPLRIGCGVREHLNLYYVYYGCVVGLSSWLASRPDRNWTQ